jgi:hypothetical protein
MRYLLTTQQVRDEVEKAQRLAEEVKRPKGVYGLKVEPDEDQDGNPMFVVSVDVDDDPDPSDDRLDELVDYEDKIAQKISSGGFASWPLVHLVPRGTTK